MTSETRANIQEQIRLLIATQPTSSASRAAEYLQTLIDGMELSSISIQKSELKALKCLLTASAIVPQVVQAPTDDEPLSWPDEVAHLLKMQVAAPIVATVPSEPVAQCCRIDDLTGIPILSPYFFSVGGYTIKAGDQLYAAPSPTEQASDAVSALREIAEMDVTKIHIHAVKLFAQTAIYKIDSVPADKGNAPAEAKSSQGAKQ